MSDYTQLALTWLRGIDPALPVALLIVTVLLLVYSIRRWLPTWWLWVESTVPFVDSLDTGPLLNALWAAWQAWPAMLFGAALSALAAGASVKHALWGALCGAISALVHVVMSNYKGLVGGPPKPPAASAKPTRISLTPPKPPSSSPDNAAMTAIGFLALVAGIALCLSLSSCGLFGSSFSWLDVAGCLPTKAELLSKVEDILLAGGNYESALKDLALVEGPAAVECAVDKFAKSFGPNTPEQSAARARGRAFLDKTGVKVSQ